jgi:phasin family protein
MFSTTDQFTIATKASIDGQIAAVTALANKAFESIAQLVELNVNTVKSSLEYSTATAQQLLSAKDSQEFFALSAAQAQPNAERALAYGRSLANIASTTQAEFAKAAEAQIAETTRKVTALVDEAGKNAPPGSENAVALLKTAIGNANAGYEQLTKNTKQAATAIEENVAKAVKQFSQTAEKATSRAVKK